MLTKNPEPKTAVASRGQGLYGHPRLAMALGLVLLAIGLAVNWRASQLRGEDFDSLYVFGKSVLRGFDIYAATDLSAAFAALRGTADIGAPWGMFYPPSIGIAFAPVALLPFDVAKAFWTLLSCGVLLAGVSQLLRRFAPGLQLGYRVLIIGALMCTSGVRWGFFSLQPAPLLFGLLCLYVALDRRRGGVAAVILAVVVCLKFTLALPFLGLAVLQRRYAVIAGVAALFIVLNGLGFMRVGGLEAVAAYQQNMARLEQSDQVNYPDFRAPNSMQRLDWPYLLNGISPDLPRSSALGMLLAAASGLFLVWQWRRCRAFSHEPATAVAFLGPLVCLTLLAVYHHHYDALALFVPAIMYLSEPVKHDRRLIALFVVPVLLYVGLYPVGQVQELGDRLFGDGSSSVVKLFGVISVNIAFASSLFILNNFVRRRSFRAGVVSAAATERIGAAHASEIALPKTSQPLLNRR